MTSAAPTGMPWNASWPPWLWCTAAAWLCELLTFCRGALLHDVFAALCLCHWPPPGPCIGISTLAIFTGETRGQTAWRSEASQSQAESPASIPEIPLPVKSSAKQARARRNAEAAADIPIPQPQDQVGLYGLRQVLLVATCIVRCCRLVTCSPDIVTVISRCQTNGVCPDHT